MGNTFTLPSSQHIFIKIGRAGCRFVDWSYLPVKCAGIFFSGAFVYNGTLATSLDPNPVIYPLQFIYSLKKYALPTEVEVDCFINFTKILVPYSELETKIV